MEKELFQLLKRANCDVASYDVQLVLNGNNWVVSVYVNPAHLQSMYDAILRDKKLCPLVGPFVTAFGFQYRGNGSLENIGVQCWPKNNARVSLHVSQYGMGTQCDSSFEAECDKADALFQDASFTDVCLFGNTFSAYPRARNRRPLTHASLFTIPV